jgi:hypothetical protein
VSLAPEHPAVRSSRRARGAKTAAPALLSLATKRPDLVEVSTAHRVLGYIEVVDHVFVALSGTRYDIATEIHQALDFGRALTALQEGTSDDDL